MKVLRSPSHPALMLTDEQLWRLTET